jgi:hypothetical protein
LNLRLNNQNAKLIGAVIIVSGAIVAFAAKSYAPAFFGIIYGAACMLLKYKSDPQNSKLIGTVSIASGVIVSFATGFYSAAISGILYGTVCILMPHIFFPTPEEERARAEKMRCSALQSSSAPINWYRSPVFILPCIGLLAYGVYTLT